MFQAACQYTLPCVVHIGSGDADNNGSPRGIVPLVTVARDTANHVVVNSAKHAGGIMMFKHDGLWKAEAVCADESADICIIRQTKQAMTKSISATPSAFPTVPAACFDWLNQPIAKR